MKIWISDLTYDQQIIAADAMPLNVASIASYAKSNIPGEHEYRIFKYPGTLINALDREGVPDVIGFSNFIWNSKLSLAIAEYAKRLREDTVVVFGGLHYPMQESRQKKWLSTHPFVDFYVIKEGEVAFSYLIKALQDGGMDVLEVKKKDIEGVHYKRDDESFHMGCPAPRIKNLSDIPSPYLNKMMDEFFDGRLMPLLTTNRGCPFKCHFCTESSQYYNKVNRRNVDQVIEEIDYIGRKMNANQKEGGRMDVYITDSNFAMYKQDYEICLALNKAKKKYGWPAYIQASTGKNAKERVLRNVGALGGGLRLSGSVQTLDPEVMHNIQRENIDARTLMDFAKIGANLETNSYSEVILALPGDSLRAHMYTLENLINSKFDFILPRQLVILPDTPMSDDSYLEEYGMKTKFRVLTKSYGNYKTVSGEVLSCAEIEEICVEGKNMNFDDYLTSREVHLIINGFYNDRFFHGALRILDLHDIPRWEWVHRIWLGLKKDETISNLFDSFQEETKRELWDSEEDLIKCTSSRESIADYLDEKMGTNLLAKYRIILFLEHLDEICKIAVNSARELVRVKGSLSDTLDKIFDQLIVFEKETRRDLFDPMAVSGKALVTFDFPAFLKEDHLTNLERFILKEPKYLFFERDNEATKMLSAASALFGTSIMGLYKQMTRIPIKKLYRSAFFAD